MSSDDETLIGTSPAMKEVLRSVDAYAVVPWPVLILGETGVGKELFSRRVHTRSPRKKRPFLAVNCGALPPSLFESELFGYERGAFSGAVSAHRGVIRQAHTGTLFLDEIGDLDLSSQVKLLRFLDRGEVRSLGTHRIDRVDVRIVAATNVNLHAAVAEGTFRLDLLERLSVLTLMIPPLRDRPRDALLLAKHFLSIFSPDASAEEKALEKLAHHRWPGNVRQLKNVLMRATVLGGGQITAELMEKILAEEAAWAALRESNLDPAFSQASLADIERHVILQRLALCQGNRKQTARELGIAKSTLQQKLRRWQKEGNSSELSALGDSTFTRLVR
jgi:transcriptional regulator with PAS, ATPase and Fis domain